MIHGANMENMGEAGSPEQARAGVHAHRAAGQVSEHAMTSASRLSGRRRSIALAVVAVAMVLDLIDMTIINVAVPTLQGRFGASDTEVQWMVAGYSTIFSLLLITGGRLGDIYGYKRAFVIGVVGFTLTSLLCGLAQTPGQLVLARLLQGGHGGDHAPPGHVADPDHVRPA
ncbi:MFS transporter [Sphingobium sp.]|uniref:MFS transporter n=1 Tax=Sphingobium sp. TaxID=1912891 RepID=UPI002610CD35|nr:MFS transporter [Sphingobium sp.]